MTSVTTFEKIHGFRSPGEYERFVRWIEERVAEGGVRELPVAHAYSSGSFAERWFRADGEEQPWRLVAPEVPFRGVFLPVDPDTPHS